MIINWITNESIKGNIYIPKYYDPSIKESLAALTSDYHLFNIGELISNGIVDVETGDEIGKMAYGTGDIPFIRTSDISNWEIKSSPKQGVSEEVYYEYSRKQNIQEGDILLVRDGTYLIGTNCFITKLDTKSLYQSHILKFRIRNKEELNPYIFFLALNSNIVQAQIRSIQFTADIIDTIGNRYLDIVIPYPKSDSLIKTLANKVKNDLENRVKGKAFVKECPVIIEQVLKKNSLEPLNSFLDRSLDELFQTINQDTISAEFGSFQAFWFNSKNIENSIYLPKYYDPTLPKELKQLSDKCNLISMGELREKGIIDYYTGDEIGKMAYGTGDISFIRTSDFSNWEIKFNPKQGISQEIYDTYKEKEDVSTNDILLVRDGTYLVGTSCIITNEDSKSLFCGGLYKIRVLKNEVLNPFLLLGLLNSYIVKRQIRTKQFTRDVIDTIGNRIDEIIIPIPKNSKVRKKITSIIEHTIESRIESRNEIRKLARKFANFQ